MVELKKDALKDVATLTKPAAEALVNTKEVLNQAVADLYVAHIALHQVHCTCVDVALWYGILRWMNTWIALMVT